MLLAYISGPYRAPTWGGIEDNIRAAKEVGLRFWNMGYSVIVPHMNTAHLDGLAPDSVWLEGDIAMMIRCDIVVMMELWRESTGAREEHRVAQELGMRIIYDGEPNDN